MKSTQGKVCLCGRPAVKWQASGWACQRCVDLEAKFYNKTAGGKVKNAHYYERIGGLSEYHNALDNCLKLRRTAENS